MRHSQQAVPRRVTLGLTVFLISPFTASSAARVRAHPSTPPPAVTEVGLVSPLATGSVELTAEPQPLSVGQDEHSAFPGLAKTPDDRGRRGLPRPVGVLCGRSQVADVLHRHGHPTSAGGAGPTGLGTANAHRRPALCGDQRTHRRTTRRGPRRGVLRPLGRRDDRLGVVRPLNRRWRQLDEHQDRQRPACRARLSGAVARGQRQVGVRATPVGRLGFAGHHQFP